MTPDVLREFCLSLPQATETFPFGEETSVFKTSGSNKVFALAALGSSPLKVSLKIDPEESIALREQYVAITPGYHLNKKHWVTVEFDSSVPDELVEELLTASHALVVPKVRARKTEG
ncbi:MAG: MmcQ-like protein [Glaciihabitans sp.]|jgi:predicted DNA-binding protein (MmcQ/YjbR family)|nr:MmcQ-like protein [Glaciihabitans sp.]